MFSWSTSIFLHPLIAASFFIYTGSNL
jgi:hypothetical protein